MCNPATTTCLLIHWHWCQSCCRRFPDFPFLDTLSWFHSPKMMKLLSNFWDRSVFHQWFFLQCSHSLIHTSNWCFLTQLCQHFNGEKWWKNFKTTALWIKFSLLETLLLPTHQASIWLGQGEEWSCFPQVLCIPCMLIFTAKLSISPQSPWAGVTPDSAREGVDLPGWAWWGRQGGWMRLQCLLLVLGGVTLLFLRLPGAPWIAPSWDLFVGDETLSAASLPFFYLCCITASLWRGAQDPVLRVPGCQTLPDVPSLIP